MKLTILSKKFIRIFFQVAKKLDSTYYIFHYNLLVYRNEQKIHYVAIQNTKTLPKSKFCEPITMQ